jgi:predicted deacetylase
LKGLGALIPTPAQYLLRFDDLCPTLVQYRWQRFLPLINEFDLKPILAIIPDNQDDELNLAAAEPGFWAQMCEMEAAGATIALHGYRHLCSSLGRSLLPLHTHTEFAGIPEETQREWIRAGLAILRGHGLNPKLFVAPRHGFDRATLRALRKEEIPIICDGFARVPFKRSGITWIPQQLWRPVLKSKGLWTICLHANFTHASQVDQLHAFLRAHAQQFTSVDRVLAEFPPARLSLTERIHAAWTIFWRSQVSRAKKRRKRRSHRAKNS